MFDHSALRIRQDGARVHVIKDGVLIIDMPWGAALEVSKSIHQIAKMAETEDQIQQVLKDQAVLTAAGAPFGLSDNSKLLKESYKLANELGYPQVEISSIVGTPAIIQQPPKGSCNGPCNGPGKTERK